jgi:hypothetical protein
LQDRGGLPSLPCPATEALLEAPPEGATLLADKGYDSNAIREAAARKNAWTNIPSRSNRKQRFAFSGTGSGTLSSAFSTASSTSGASPLVTTSAPKTTSPPSNSSARASGALHVAVI